MQRLLIRISDLIDGSPAKHDKAVYLALFLALFLNLALWVAVAIAFWGSDEYVILQYNMYFGISSFGHWYRLLFLPLAGLIVVVVNGFVSFQIYLEYRLLSRILPAISVLINSILIIIVGLLIYINL